MRRQLTALIAAALGVGLAGFVPGSSASATAERHTPTSLKTDSSAYRPVSKVVSRAEQRATARYWTAERMRNAINADSASLTTAQLRQLAAPVPADEIIDQRAMSARDSAIPGAAAVGTDDAARRRTTGEPWGHRKSFVAKTTGRAFFNTGGKSYSCSAAVINGRRKSVLITAGHCVFSDHTWRWVNHFQFIPGYYETRRGFHAPYGRYFAKRLFTTGQYHNHHKFRYDVGFVRLGRRVHGSKHVGAVVGQQGYSFGGRKGTPWADVFGYPATPPRYHGKFLIHCAGGTRSAGRMGYLLRCRMNGGSSGGPWIRGIHDGGRGRIFSVVSFVNIDKRRAPKIRGPYFGRSVYRAYKAAERKR
jgi:V8-like Glu-specific endopeptidase